MPGPKGLHFNILPDNGPTVFGKLGFSSSLFLYFKCLDERVDLGKINPFKLAKSINGIFGDVYQVKPVLFNLVPSFSSICMYVW